MKKTFYVLLTFFILSAAFFCTLFAFSEEIYHSLLNSETKELFNDDSIKKIDGDLQKDIIESLNKTNEYLRQKSAENKLNTAFEIYLIISLFLFLFLLDFKGELRYRVAILVFSFFILILTKLCIVKISFFAENNFIQFISCFIFTTVIMYEVVRILAMKLFKIEFEITTMRHGLLTGDIDPAKWVLTIVWSILDVASAYLLFKLLEIIP